MPRRLPLRSRLALLTAAAVAVAVAASALACWVITRDQMRGQLDRSLVNSVPDVLTAARDRVWCDQGPGASGRTPFDAARSVSQFVLPDGTRCPIQGDSALAVGTADRSVAAGVPPSAVLHDATTRDGTKVRVYTTYVPRLGLAVSVARPVDELDGALRGLALLLTCVAAAGVAGAGLIGLLVARTGLRPVDELTEVVEHIARTEDLATRIPVRGGDEIARLSSSFNTMTGALASSRERQQQLIADAGHELRTPLTSLSTNVDLLLRSEESGRPLPEEDRRTLLVSVRAQMRELASLVGDLLELSRPEAAPGGPVGVVALHEVAQRAVARARLRGRGLAIASELEPWYVRGEAFALERAVVNLLDNAVKFSPGRGEVDVRLAGGTLTVRDHGPGIPADELPHVFERFWRSPSARSLPGSGLGLSIVARTVGQAGGEVSLTGAPGGGTVASMALPGAPTPPPQPPAAGDPPVTARATPPRT
jgi:two-component system, OmpR family, sensor histidine kinase MprB